MGLGFGIIGEGTLQMNADVLLFLDSMSKQQPDFGTAGSEIIVDGTDIYLDIEAVDGGDIDFVLDGTERVLDCTTGSGVSGKARVELLAGTKIKPLAQTVFAFWSEQDNAIALGVVEDVPSGAFLPIAYLSIQDSVTVAAEGAMRFQRLSECYSHGGQGSNSRVRENTRLVGKGGTWWKGAESFMTITTNAGSRDNIDVESAAGIVYQMNKQYWGTKSISVDGTFIINQGDGTNNYDKYTDIATITKDGTGSTLVDGDMVYIDIMGLINNNPTNNKLVFSVSKKYTVEANIISDGDNKAFTLCPHELRTVGFPMCRLLLKYNTAASGTWTNVLGSSTTEEWKNTIDNFTSTNFPNAYPTGMNLNHTFTVVSGGTSMRLNFTDFNTEANYDFVKVYEGANHSNLLATYHGNLGTFQSQVFEYTSLYVTITSDSSVTRIPGVKCSGFDELVVTVSSTNELLNKLHCV